MTNAWGIRPDRQMDVSYSIPSIGLQPAAKLTADTANQLADIVRVEMGGGK